MPRNSQGLYTLPLPPVIPNTLIESQWANPTLDDIASALTASLPRDGSAPMTGALTLAAGTPTNSRHAASKAYVDSFMAYATGMPIGSVFAFAPNTAPAGYLLCDGAAVSRTTYADLFAAIGTTFGSGDGVATFNVPDLRDWFIRGRGTGRTIGSTQAAALALHTHAVSDPGHTHVAGQGAHSHTVSTGGHNHTLTDPGHVHSVSGGVTGATSSRGFTPISVTETDATNAATTGISIAAVGDLGGSTSLSQPAVSVSGSYTGIGIGATGDAETRPQNVALDYYIKAVNDSANTGIVTGIDSSDANMIAIDNSNPAVPTLDIKSNVAFGTVKLDAGGKVPLNQIPQGAQQLLGFFDASSGNNPSQAYPTTTFSSGDTYIISVGGSINCYDPVTLVSALRLVVAGALLQYITGSVTNPTGWYYTTQSGTIAASSVIFTPAAGITSTNVQAAIEEVKGDIPTTAAQIAFVPGSTIGASDVQGAVIELATETQAALALKQDAATAVTKDTSTGAAQLPVGTQLQRPTVPAPGMLRFNDDTDGFEGFNGTNWGAVGGGATGAAGNPVFYENDTNVTANYSITSGKNAGSFGPITINSGVTVTVPSGSVWSIV